MGNIPRLARQFCYRTAERVIAMLKISETSFINMQSKPSDVSCYFEALKLFIPNLIYGENYLLMKLYNNFINCVICFHFKGNPVWCICLIFGIFKIACKVLKRSCNIPNQAHHANKNTALPFALLNIESKNPCTCD